MVDTFRQTQTNKRSMKKKQFKKPTMFYKTKAKQTGKNK